MLKQCPRVNDCADLLTEGYNTSGLYAVYLEQTRKYITVYCDMETDGGGWLVRIYLICVNIFGALAQCIR